MQESIEDIKRNSVIPVDKPKAYQWELNDLSASYEYFKTTIYRFHESVDPRIFSINRDVLIENGIEFSENTKTNMMLFRGLPTSFINTVYRWHKAPSDVVKTRRDNIGRRFDFLLREYDDIDQAIDELTKSLPQRKVKECIKTLEDRKQRNQLVAVYYQDLLRIMS